MTLDRPAEGDVEWTIIGNAGESDRVTRTDPGRVRSVGVPDGRGHGESGGWATAGEPNLCSTPLTLLDSARSRACGVRERSENLVGDASEQRTRVGDPIW